MDWMITSALERHPGQTSKVVGLYQMLLRRSLEHFFPEAELEPAGDRSFIGLDGVPNRANFWYAEDPDGLGIQVQWFGSRYLLRPGGPNPFLPAERALAGAILRVVDNRFRSLFDPEVSHREDLFQFAVEDQVVAEYLGAPGAADRVPTALEALRVAALSTYENRRVSSGVLLLGTDGDPAEPERTNPPGAPRYNVRLSALKSIHRICDGLRTVFLVDRNGDLAWPVDLRRWTDTVQGPGRPSAPCPRPYGPHARATAEGGHVVLVLSPAQEIKVFAGGTMTFAFSDARWRLLDIPTKFAAWAEAVGPAERPDLAERIFQAALNLSENRHGALFVVLREPEVSLLQLVAPEDRICHEVACEDPDDPDGLSPRLAKRALHHLARGQNLGSLDPTVLEALAGVDGAVVIDPSGRLLSFGAILRLSSETALLSRAAQGARTTAALAASFHGPVLKVSEDGFVTMFLGGRRIWEI